jgi:alpha-amylase/alpha-mannosidase (GH57 family)
VNSSNDAILKKDFENLQISDHFYYMSTKFFSDGEVHSYFNPYDSPYEAFINYMNILSDFEIRVNASAIQPVDDEITKLSKIISDKDELIERYAKELANLKTASRKRQVGSLAEEALEMDIPKAANEINLSESVKTAKKLKRIPDGNSVNGGPVKKTLSTVKKTADVVKKRVSKKLKN